MTSALLSLGILTGWSPATAPMRVTNYLTAPTNIVTTNFVTNGYIISRQVLSINGTNATAITWPQGEISDVEILYGDAFISNNMVIARSAGPIVLRRIAQSDGKTEAQVGLYMASFTPAYTNSQWVFHSFKPGSIAEYQWTNVLAAVGALTNDPNQTRVFSALPWCYSNTLPYTQGWIWKITTNLTFWAYGKSNQNWTTTCGQTWYQGTAKLVTKRHWVTAGHMFPPVGEKHYWVGPQGQTATRTTVAVTNGLSAGIDLAVCLLDDDTPDWVQPAWMIDPLFVVQQMSKGMPLMLLVQSKRANLQTNPAYSIPALWCCVATFGDSGSPNGFVLDGRFIMYGYGGFDPKLVGQWITNLNAWNGVPQTYALQIVDTNEIVSRFVQ
jgi:hypothetical protein